MGNWSKKTHPIHQKPAPSRCCRSIPKTNCVQGNACWPQKIYGGGAFPKNPSSSWPRHITEHCMPMAPPWRFLVYFISKRFVFWQAWSTWCPQISQWAFSAHNGSSLTQADSLCGWWRWYSFYWLTTELCWAYPGACRSWWDDISSEQLSWQILGPWWLASALKKRPWSWASSEWWDLLHSWMA